MWQILITINLKKRKGEENNDIKYLLGVRRKNLEILCLDNNL